jgi:hypothetical protein
VIDRRLKPLDDKIDFRTELSVIVDRTLGKKIKKMATSAKHFGVCAGLVPK